IMLENGVFDGLDYFIYSLDYTVPIACAAAITPIFSYKGSLLNRSRDIDVMYENIIVTMIPSHAGSTHILFAWLPEQKKSEKFMNELEMLDNKRLEFAISSILIGEIENTFISPLLWEKMSPRT